MGIIIIVIVLGSSAYEIISYLLKSRTGVHLSGEILDLKDVSDANTSVTKLHVAFEYKGKERQGVVRIPSSDPYIIRSFTAYNRIDMIYVPLTGKLYAARIPDEVERHRVLWNTMLVAVAVIAMFYSFLNM